jgi:hypothetical protein
MPVKDVEGIDHHGCQLWWCCCPSAPAGRRRDVEASNAAAQGGKRWGVSPQGWADPALFSWSLWRSRLAGSANHCDGMSSSELDPDSGTMYHTGCPFST